MIAVARGYDSKEKDLGVNGIYKLVLPSTGCVHRDCGKR